VARIYAGNPEKVDAEILAAIKELPDDFVAFAEFDIERNVDWFIIHLRPDDPASLIVTELKRTTKRLRGDVNGPWEESPDDQQWTPMLSSGREINPYQQVTAAANAMKEWLWVHQRFFLDGVEERPEEAFKVWPDLLILGPTGLSPILPLRPPSRFGYWFHDIDRWLAHLRTWRSLPGGVVLGQTGIRRLVDQLRLVPIWPDPSSVVQEEPAPSPPTLPPPVQTPAGAPELPAILARLDALEQRLARLEAGARPEPAAGAAAKRLSEAERVALVGAVTTAKLTGRSRAVPTIISYMDRLLGYHLKEVGYNGRGTATALMEQARAEGIVTFGPLSGPNVTIYLPDEDVPAA
jgi:hypothetical protein